MNSSRLQQKSIFTSLKYVTKAGVTACSIMSVKICPAVFVYLLQFRTCAGGYALRGNTDYDTRTKIAGKL